MSLQGMALPGIAPGGRLLIPYLVGQPGQNAGSAGFAALLRDHIPVGEDERVLLILDSQPLETVRTAAEDAGSLPSLQWQALAEAATAGASDEVKPLLAAVLEDDRFYGRLPRTATVLGSLRRVASHTEIGEAGAALHSLGCYLSDPEAYGDTRRLRISAAWRLRLEGWLAPGQDFERKLSARYGYPEAPGLAQILNAITPFGLNYAAFTYRDLPDQAPRRQSVQLAYPVSPSEPARVAFGHRAVVWKPGGGSFGITLATAAVEDTTAALTWSDVGRTEEIPVAAGDRQIEIVAKGAGWRFAQLALKDGYTAELAVFLDAGHWAPFEASLDLDFDKSAFRCAEPRLLALGPDGELAGQPAVHRPGTTPDAGERENYTASLGQEKHLIPLLISDDSGPDVPRPGPEDPGEQPPRDDDPDEPSDPGSDPARPRPGQPVPTAASVAHARLAAKMSGNALGAAHFLVTADGDGRRSGAIATPGRYDLVPQVLASGLEGLELERQILNSPQLTAFTVRREQMGRGGVLDPHPHLEQLVVSGIPGMDAFLRARAEFFCAIGPAGSVHAVAAGIGIEEARAYVGAYEALLDSLLESGRFVAEYERLFLCDVVADAQLGELLIAPTNPLSVAYLMTLAAELETWHSKASQVLPEDLSACSLRHLVPYFALQGDWYETGGVAPLLWRRYRPASVGISGDHRPAYIARRIDHFTRVHPEYRDDRQLLGLAFHEPGDGSAVLDALRALARPHALGTATSALPRLAVTIISASKAPTAVEELVMGQVHSQKSEGATDRLLQDRLQVIRTTPEEERPEFAHLSFVFESSLARQPAAVDLDARASTLFVNGLAAVPGRHIEPGRNETTFMWGTFTGVAPAHGQLSKMVHKLLELVSGMPRDPISRKRTRMPSTRVGRAFLDDLYGGSAWVVHLDKLLGLEAFAPDASGRNARYLIDYDDRLDLAQPGLDAITATARIEPYRRALRQALTELGRPSEAGLDRLLQLFNGVSGQWALDLVGANPNTLRERIGLAATVAMLQDSTAGLHTGTTAGVVIPLDEMLQALPPGARPTKDRLCDDLLYVQIPIENPGPLELRGRLLEVKYRGATDAEAAGVARQQLQRARDWLSSTFGDTASPRHPFRSRDLSELLRSAATRASAFGLMTQTMRSQLEPALEIVSSGKFELRLDYRVDGETLHGDFVSIEADNAVPVHRQLLAGQGSIFGHVRLGRPALEALAAGRPVPGPTSPSAVTSEGAAPDRDGVTRHAEIVGRTAAAKGASSAHEPGPARETLSAEVSLFAARLDSAFTKYGLTVEPFRPELAQIGSSIIRFRTRTLGRLSITDVERRARDLGREIAAPGQVSVGDEPGFVTVDVPRSERVAVPLGAVFGLLDKAPARPGALNFVAGMAPSGAVEVADLSRLPHLLVAGATGSGKSVFLRGLLVELLRARTPEQLSLLIIDPKRLDFAAFAKAPHVRGNTIISDPDEALERLQFTLEAELTLRQPLLERAGVSSAAEYYEAGGRLEDLPQLVILVDEFADLVLAGSDRRAFSELVQRYAQLTRAYGIFLILATQRPSVDVVTGSIKANLSARIAFSLPSAADSRTVLDRGGAEDLLGEGDLLFYRNGRVRRLQAPFATTTDIRGVIS
ncbi:FtsK/SpoIIIE domain-containing protein [Micromonospora profundi]|uniref:FtsK/SpoIIIE domain-containing protein n=1 Tax=Micromonospora profundi TaxID=1420889 RepID=UPI003657B8CD